MTSHRFPRSARARNRRAPRPMARFRLETLEDRWVPAQTAVLVKDINVGSENPFRLSGPGSNPAEFLNLNGTLYFTATDGTSGVELWKSDGTSAGTVRVADINPGAGSSDPQELTALGDVVFFTADDGQSGRRLWRTDGTAEGTRIVRDYFGGTFDYFDFSDLTSFNGDLLLKCNAHTDMGDTGPELRKVKTESSGYEFIHPFLGIPGAAAIDPTELTVVPNADGTSRLWFAGNTEFSGRELYRTDGTLAGTITNNIRMGNNAQGMPASSNPRALTASGTSLFFVANDGTRGDELWKAPALGLPMLVRDINSGPGSSLPLWLTDVNGVLFFTANDGTHGQELWRTTTFGPPSAVLVKDIRVGRNAFGPTSLANVNGTLYFAADDGTHGKELWKSTGTEPGTTLVKNIRRNSGSSSPTWLTDVNGTLYFTANSGLTGEEVWISDGTDAGTRVLFDVGGPLRGSSPTWLTDVNGTLFFAANNFRNGNELWRSRENELHTVVRPADQANAEGEAVSLPVAVINPDGDPLRYSATGLPAGLTIHPTTGVISGTVGAHVGRTQPYSVTISVTDGFETARASFLWSVSDGTVPTIRNPGPLRNNEGNVLGDLHILASDPEGDPLTFRASGLPAGLQIGTILNPNRGTIYGTIGPQAAVNGTSGPPADGVYQVTVYASDGFHEVSTSFLWTIGDVTRPVFDDPGPLRNNEGNGLSLRVRARDPEGDALTYQASGLPPGLFLVNSPTLNDAVIGGLLGPHSAGTYPVTLTASDGHNTGTVTFTWTIGDLDPPTVQHPGTQNSQAGATVALQMVASDADQDPLAYTALGLPPGLIIDQNTGRISGTIAPEADGGYNVTVRVTDGTTPAETHFVWNVQGLIHSGGLDPTFDEDGLVTTPFGQYLDRAQATAVQRDGKVVAAGFTTDLIDGFHTGIALARYEESGHPDLTFGTGGQVVTDLSREDQARAVLIQPDDKILVAGFTSRATRDFVILRYLPDGRLDSTFGGGSGLTVLDFGGDDSAAALALQEDGMIVVGGTTVGPGVSDFALARLTADGQLDSGFGAGGKVVTDLAGGTDVLAALAVQPDRAIIAAGSARVGGINQFAAARYLADGTLDITFGTDTGGGRTGKAFVPVGQDSGAVAVAVRTDGRLVLGGNSYDTGTGSAFTVLRLLANGDLDTAFGTNGVTATSLPGPNEAARAMAVQADGKIVLGGRADGPAGADFALVRYTADGQLDTGFDFDGILTTDFGFDGADELYGLALDGTRLVAVGSAANGPDPGDFAVARYTL